MSRKGTQLIGERHASFAAKVLFQENCSSLDGVGPEEKAG